MRYSENSLTTPMSMILALAPLLGQGFVVPAASKASAMSSRTSTPLMDIDMSTVVGVGAALLGVGGGVGLIAFTENAGDGLRA